MSYVCVCGGGLNVGAIVLACECVCIYIIE